MSLVGDAAGERSDNLLVRGDSLDALRVFVRTPEYAEVYRGKMKLVYIDPPFNTGQAFEHYGDSLEHSVWLGMMRERLVLIRELLAPDGSVWVHLDDAEMVYCKVLMDEIFGRANSLVTSFGGLLTVAITTRGLSRAITIPSLFSHGPSVG